MYSCETDFRCNVKGSFTMRKIFALGLMALSLSFLSNPVLAGDASDCETIRDDPNRALYGLCIAYWNTSNAVSRARILANFVKKGGIAEEMPGLPVAEPDDPGAFVECPCWFQDEHVQAFLDDPSVMFNGDDVYSCNPDGTGFEVLTLNSLVTQFILDDGFCELVHESDSTGELPIDNWDAELTCRAQIHELIAYFTDDDCTSEP
jgi:hypothetical protein